MKAKTDFEETLARHGTELYRYCYYKSGGDRAVADDAYSDVLLTLYKKWDKLSRGDGFVSYMYRVAENCVMAQLRRKKTRSFRTPSLDAAIAEGTLLDEAYFDRYFNDETDEEEYIRRLEALLSPDELELFRLRFCERLPLLEVAEHLKTPYATVRYRALKLEKKLRREITKIFSEI